MERYGSAASNLADSTNLRLDPDRTSLVCLRNGTPLGGFRVCAGRRIQRLERHRGRGLGFGCGISKDAIAAALKTFKSVKRRLEVRAQVNGITIIDDFAHHPTAIAGTLAALRARYPEARLWAILEPRSNTLRRNVMQDDLAKSLALADEVIVTNVFKSEAIPEAERLICTPLRRKSQAWKTRAHCFRTPMPSSTWQRRKCGPATSSRFFPTAALAESTKSCRNVCRLAGQPAREASAKA